MIIKPPSHPAITLSYIIATRNRLTFLKITLEKLIGELQPDEEIVVVDGNSTDGAKEYLQQLYNDGKIHQFISGPDKNQAHAWNKAMLMARGEIIKKIMDDDVFCFSAIKRCKDYLMQNPTVDIIISNDLTSSLIDFKNIEKKGRVLHFKKWKGGFVPSFTFGDVHLLIRRSSLSYIGLYNTAFVMMDWEYSLRISYLKANIVYYTGFNALNVGHPQTVTALKNNKLIHEQGKRGCVFYEYAGDRAEISLWSEIKILAGRTLQCFRWKNKPADILPADIKVAYDFYYDYINEINSNQAFTFL